MYNAKTPQGVYRLLNLSISLVLLIICCFALSSCITDKTKRKFRIGFSQCTGDDNWRRRMLADMKQEMAFHPDIEFLYRDAKDNSQHQAQQVKELLNEHIDLLLISPNEAKPLTSVVEDAFNNGIPVIVIDRTIASQLYTAIIGADNEEVGRMAGDYAASLLHGKGNIIEVIGRPASTPAIGRQKGFRESITKYPGMTIISEVYGNWLKDDAAAELMKIQDKLIHADLVFAHNDVMALGTYHVCKKLGIENKVKIIGVDGQPGPGSGLDLISNHLINATMLYPTGGQEAIRTAFKILNGESFTKDNILQTLVIDSTNVRPMQLQANKIDEQQKDIERQQALLETQQAVYNSQTTLLNITFDAFILVLVLGIIALLAWRNNIKINRRLSVSNNEILLQRNQLIDMTAKAKEATDTNFNFFTNISHELRTPLTLILGPLEDALTSSKLHFTIKNDLEIMQKNAFRLLRLVNQLMDFRKIEHSRMKLRASENNLNAFVAEILNDFKEIAKRKSIRLNASYRVNDLMVWFDTNLLDKVLFNLLSNAFKFTKENGFVTVTVSVSKDGKEAIIEVEDTGIGMTPETAAHAFDLFYQEQGTAFKGSGLGLALSKELIQLHHGTISVESEKWKGTSFQVLLPLGNTHLPADEMVKEANSATTSYEDIKVYIADNNTHPAIIPYENNDTPKEYSILLIEDSDDLRIFLQYRLSANFEVYEAANGNMGLSMAYELVPDLIICDIALPGKDGLQITEILKTDIRSSHIPVIILTANSSIEKQIASMKLRADAFIAKPFNLQHLEETIKSLLKNRKVLREHYTADVSQESNGSNPKKLDRKFINEFTATVEKNIANENFSVEDICKATGISRVQLNRKIKALLGVNVNDYILNARLQKAKYLLTNEDLTIAEVAYKVGFSSQAYFATVFKNKLSITPSEFKEKTRG
jgi:signal transduction histidine kinase/DNA-binding response OmpR family regulator